MVLLKTDIALKYKGIFCLAFHLLDASGSLQEPKRKSYKFRMQITISKITLPTSIALAHIAMYRLLPESNHLNIFLLHHFFPTQMFELQY